MLVERKRSSQWCQICEKFATDALSYLEKNQTETEITAFLHQDCAKLDNFEEEVFGKFSVSTCLLRAYLR